MDDLRLTQSPATTVSMLIRRPVAEVFEAFVDPEITSNFWFTGGSGRLTPGAQVQWDWAMYGVSAPVTVRAIEPKTRIVIEWPGYSGQTTVEWTFTPHSGDGTLVRITETGFTGNGDSLVQQVSDSTQGFCFVLAGLKAWLEYSLRLNLVGDAHPEAVVNH